MGRAARIPDVCWPTARPCVTRDVRLIEGVCLSTLVALDTSQNDLVACGCSFFSFSNQPLFQHTIWSFIGLSEHLGPTEQPQPVKCTTYTAVVPTAAITAKSECHHHHHHPQAAIIIITIIITTIIKSLPIDSNIGMTVHVGRGC